ncbi:Protein sidekick-1 [Porites harrisoni]
MNSIIEQPPCFFEENLAYQKKTSQSSTFKSSGRAVDGDSNTDFNVGSCAHTLDEKQPWWRVDLGNVELVNEVYVVNRGGCCGNRLNPFEIRVGVNSSNGGITNPKCGDGYSVLEGKGASFFCRPSLYGRYVTIRRHDERTIALHFCEVEVYSARRACQIQAIGLASSDAIPDNSFSATTDRSGNEASKGRLNGDGAWSPSRNDDANDYLQIDLKDQFFICAVATQGSSSDDHWTTMYKLSYSLENLNWLTYQENDIDKVFNANDGRNDIVKHSLVGLIRSRFIRFQPTDFIGRKALRVEVYGILTTAAPSHAPTNFTVTPSTSTSVQASWQLPTADFQMITGFRLLYRNFSFVEDPLTVITIESNSTLTYEVTGLGIFTKYEFQVLAFSIMSDGPSSVVKTARTNAEAPSQAPTNLSVTINNSTSVSVNWQLPPGISRNGVILGFTLYYRKSGTSGQANTATVHDGTVLSTTITGLGKFTGYEFQVSAFTCAGDGPRSSVVTERTSADTPSFGPDTFFTTELNETTFNISWAPLPKEKSNGIVVLYEANAELVATRGRSRRSVASSKGVNTTKTFAVLYDFLTCSQYSISVRAFTAVGPGPYGPATQLQTSTASQAPTNLSVTINNSTSVSVNWQLPPEISRNGVILGFTLYYRKNGTSGQANTATVHDGTVLSTTITGLGKFTGYEFQVSAFTCAGDGPRSSVVTERTSEDTPSFGPDTFFTTELNETTFNISWAPLPTEKSNGIVVLYEANAELVATRGRSRRSVASSKGVNTTKTFAVLYDFLTCSQYSISVRAFTAVGPGPYGPATQLQTSRPAAPSLLKAVMSAETNVTLEWTPPKNVPVEGLRYKVKYTGRKNYNTSFFDTGERDADEGTNLVMRNLVPGTLYNFKVNGISVCGEGQPNTVDATTKMAAPLAPYVGERTDISTSESSGIIQLWPAEQINGPVSAYQVIVLKVTGGNEKLPPDYDFKLKDSQGASQSNLDFYICAKISNNPVHETTWKFTVGDEMNYGTYKNTALQRGKDYIVFQRALTDDKAESVVLKGNPIKVAKISVTKVDKSNDKGTQGGNASQIYDKTSNTAFIISNIVSAVALIISLGVNLFLWRALRNAKTSDKLSAKELQVKDHENKGNAEVSFSPKESNYMELRPTQMQQTTINSEYGSLMENPDGDADDGKTKHDYVNASFHLHPEPCGNKEYENI